jgi:two-component SAPR family response regulator
VKPDIHIIFVTGYSQYAVEAFSIHATGYLLKPVTEDAVSRELTFIYRERQPKRRIEIKTFGGFDLYVDGQLVRFGRAKSKELLAYLVDRNGATCTNGEMLAVLWEDKPDTASLHSHLRNLIFDLSHTLEDAGVTGLLIRGRSTLALDTSKVDCDYYNFLRGSRSATNSYRGEYMTQYSWAEVTRSALRQQANVQKTASIPSYYVPPTGF